MSDETVDYKDNSLDSIILQLTQIIGEFGQKNIRISKLEVNSNYSKDFVYMCKYLLPKIRNMNEILRILNLFFTGNITEKMCIKLVSGNLNEYPDENDKNLKCCDNCGSWFKTSKTAQRFCSSNCRSSYHMRKSRREAAARKAFNLVNSNDKHLKVLDDLLVKFTNK